ncbi:hypothetical protein D3C83_125410 [compost metagenome]
MARLGLPPGTPTTQQLTLIVLSQWCRVLIETDRLARLTVDEAEELGRILTASLLDPDICKGAK